jgi:GxxExxY protein
MKLMRPGGPTRLLHQDITDGIIGAFYRVYNGLGYGFFEALYRDALAHDLRKHGYRVAREVAVDV